MATVTLAPRLKSSTFAIILWLFAAPIQHKIARLLVGATTLRTARQSFLASACWRAARRGNPDRELVRIVFSLDLVDRGRARIA